MMGGGKGPGRIGHKALRIREGDDGEDYRGNVRKLFLGVRDEEDEEEEPLGK